MLDTRIYEIEYHDSHKASITSNTIAEKLFLRSMKKVTDMFC